MLCFVLTTGSENSLKTHLCVFGIHIYSFLNIDLHAALGTQKHSFDLSEDDPIVEGERRLAV